ncbi:uncharacterized protein LOC133711718 [Rosa rugosa]|uniref:uncharacterized protein LOC133711718 n=1 Tax=Rosa rugosa TaxID=74645 RepID=UPI002B40F0DC|nr:uncharacterized protein LOC133711718 [Rosa rugosa]
MPDGTKKYKVARFNKDGGKIWLDGLDPDKIAWTEFGNIAWDLGYREKPISYYYKMPRTYCNEGWMPLRNDADALEMVKLIPLKTRQISVFITGGGRRRKKEAKEDALRPVDPNWENPLNRLTAAEKRKVELEANIAGNKLNRPGVSGCGSSGVNVVGGGDVNARQEGVRQKARADGVINLDSDSDLEASEGGRQQSQGTFTGLSDLVPHLFASKSVAQAGNDNIGQGQRNKAEEQAEVGWISSRFYNKHIPRPRVKHTVQKRWEGRRLPCVLAAEQQESEPIEVQAVEPTQTEPGHPEAEASQFEAQPSQVEGEASKVEPTEAEAKEAEAEASQFEAQPSQVEGEASKVEPTKAEAKEAEAEASQFEAQPSQVEGEASKVEPTEAEAKEAEAEASQFEAQPSQVEGEASKVEPTKAEAKEAEAEASQFEAQPSQVEGEASKVEPTKAEAKEAEAEASQFEAQPSQVEGEASKVEPTKAEAKEAEAKAKGAETEASQFEAQPNQVEGEPSQAEPSQAEAKEAESGEKKGKKQNQGEKGKKQNKGVGKGKTVGESEKGKKVGESERGKKQKFSEAEKGKKVAVDSSRPASKKKGRQTKEPRVIYVPKS